MANNCNFAEDRAEIDGECRVTDMINIHKFLVEMAEANMNMEAVKPIAEVFGLDLPEQNEYTNV